MSGCEPRLCADYRAAQLQELLPAPFAGAGR